MLFAAYIALARAFDCGAETQRVPNIGYQFRNHLALAALRYFGGLRKRLMGPFGTAILARSENGLLLVPAQDVFVGRHLCFEGSYDPEILAFLLSQCYDESAVLVVGAHVGAFAIPLAKKARSVAAVEANPATCELLKMNALLNAVPHMSVYNFAAGDGNEDVPFLVSTQNTGGSKIRMGDWNRKAYVHDQPDTVTVPMKRLNDAFPGQSFDLIIMDIEGSEALALAGMPDLLSRCNGLVVEIVDHHLNRIARVTNEQFLSLVTPYFDEAIILPDGHRKLGAVSSAPYSKCAFGELMSVCREHDVANVLFRRTSAAHPHE